MSKKTSKKTIKKAVSKKKSGNSKSAKPAAKKSKVVKKIASKKSKPKAAKKAAKKVVVKKKATKPVAKKKTSKPAAKKVQAKKAAPAKKVAKKPVVKAKPVVVKKPKAEKPVKVAKPAPKTTVVKHSAPAMQHTAPTIKKAVVIEKQLPEPHGKFELEYIIHTSTPILFEFLTTPSGLSEWFCDDVNIREGIYAFQWDQNIQKARLIKMVEESVVRYQWLDKNDNSYFEFRIERDDLTNDISLIVSDFADTPDEKHSSELLWNSQIEKLLSVLGSH